MRSAYELDVGQAVPAAGIERTPSLVLLVSEIVRLCACCCFDILARIPSARFNHTFFPSGWKIRRSTESLVGLKDAYY